MLIFLQKIISRVLICTLLFVLLQLHTSFYEFSGLRKYDLNSMFLCTEPILNFDEDEIIKSFLWNLLPFQDFATVTPYHTSSSTKDLRYLMVCKDIHSHCNLKESNVFGKTKNTTNEMEFKIKEKDKELLLIIFKRELKLLALLHL